MKRDWLLHLFAGVLCVLYGILAAGQVLGIAGIYRVFLVIPLSLIFIGAALFFYFRLGKSFRASFLSNSSTQKNQWFPAVFLVIGAAIFLLLIFYPLVHWPLSPITHDLPWDAGQYHFPKAVEMISTGSARDLSISYGEYPFGYESLVALALSLNHQGWLLGSAHALLALFMLLCMLVLTVRYTRLPRGPVLFVTVLLLMSYQLARGFDSNIWWLFWPQIILIGKNDLFLAAALLAVLIFTPYSKDGPFFPFGLALASAVALSIKPNSGPIVLFAWLLLLFFLWKSGQLRRQIPQLAASAAVMLPGVLWIFRNLLEQGSIFSREAMDLSQRSIAANLTNPFFYNYIPLHFYYILGIMAVAALVSIFRPALRYYCLPALLLFITFVITPGSAFSGTGSLEEPALFEWRYALGLVAYLFILLLTVFESLILKAYTWAAKKNWVALPLGLAVAALGLGIIWTQRDLLGSNPEKTFVLRDQYDHAVGVDGYYSAYDYVQRNVKHSVVIVENGLPYYLYDPGFTNSVTRSRPADYAVYLQTAWLGQGGYPDILSQPQWSRDWQLVYQDPEGRVYKRK